MDKIKAFDSPSQTRTQHIFGGTVLSLESLLSWLSNLYFHFFVIKMTFIVSDV